MISQHDGVEDGEEFSHGGDEGDHLRLAVVQESSVEAADRGVVLDGDDGGHVEGVSHAGPAANENGSQVFEAEYDYRTRRVAKTEGGDTTLYRYDGGISFQEVDASGNVDVEFVRGSAMGGGIGSILYSDRDSSGGGGGSLTTEYFTYNAVGHTVALTDALGNLTKTTPYEAFGNEVASTGSSDNNRLANTKERDFSIGLDNHGYRYYDPSTGRYTTRDPIGYGDGPNVYLSVHGNPINHVDPLGLGGQWFWQDAADLVYYSFADPSGTAGTMAGETNQAYGDPAGAVSDITDTVLDDRVSGGESLRMAGGIAAGSLKGVPQAAVNGANAATKIYDLGVDAASLSTGRDLSGAKADDWSRGMFVDPTSYAHDFSGEMVFGGVGGRLEAGVVGRLFKGLKGLRGTSGADEALGGAAGVQRRVTGARDLSPSKLGDYDAAEAVYDGLRKTSRDVDDIIENSELARHQVERVKNHIFNRTHELDDGARLFDADPDIANMWSRLRGGGKEAPTTLSFLIMRERNLSWSSSTKRIIATLIEPCLMFIPLD